MQPKLGRMHLSHVLCQEIALSGMHFTVYWLNALLLDWRTHFVASLDMASATSRLLPSPYGYVYLGTGTQQLGRSLPLSGCLACPGLEAIVICYCSGGGKGRIEVLHTASRHPLSSPLFLCSAEKDKCLVWLLISNTTVAQNSETNIPTVFKTS